MAVAFLWHTRLCGLALHVSSKVFDPSAALFGLYLLRIDAATRLAVAESHAGCIAVETAPSAGLA